MITTLAIILCIVSAIVLMIAAMCLNKTQRSLAAMLIIASLGTGVLPFIIVLQAVHRANPAPIGEVLP